MEIKKEKKTILFYAPLGNKLPSHLLGGGEKGCQRTKEILEHAGYNVITLDKANMSHGIFNYIKSAIHTLFYASRFLKKNPNIIFYIVGFYERNIWLEAFLIYMGSKKNKTIYEARNGRLISAYKENGKIYKKIMKYILTKANIIFAQGKEYVDFISKNFNKKAIYTPNYVLNKYLIPYFDKPINTIRLVYFGRITESKNVDITIKIAYELKNKGYNVELTLIGGYSQEYKKNLDSVISKCKLSKDSIIFLGSQPFEKICEVLKKSHFFIFPSQEKKEGHSNALTEAMAFGVVPIVSNAGFNASIVSEKNLVVNKIDSICFANQIDDILVQNKWEYYSKKVYNRVQENYTESIVGKKILEAISNL